MKLNPNKVNKSIRALEFERSRRDAHYFIFTHVKTKDEHDTLNPVKPFPDIPYLRCILDMFLVSGKIIKPTEAKYLIKHDYPMDHIERMYNSGIIPIEKSRQMRITWIVSAYLLWRGKFRDHQLLLVQSKREDDAANLVFNKEPHVARISFMESHLPKHLQTMRFPRAGAYAHLFVQNGSHYWGIPEGGDIVRSNTPSVIFSDEAAFQPQFGASYTASIPCITSGGQYIAVSSAEPGEFQELVEST